MNIFITDVVLCLIILVNPCLLLPLLKTGEGFHQFLLNKNNQYGNNRTYSTALVSVKQNPFDGMISENHGRPNDHASVPFLHRSREGQALEQFSQDNLANNQHDASNWGRLLWQQYHGQTFQPHSSPSTSKPWALNPLNVSDMNTLPSQETAQLNPVNMVNTPTIGTTGAQPIDNMLIDLLHNQQSITGTDSNRFEFMPKLFKPLFNPHLTELASFVGRITSDKDCTLIVKTLPILLINGFVDMITTISKLQLAKNLMIPFLVLSLMNFIMSFLFLDEYCPDSN